jgi:medium-chain acyl-[acyl-carrier-protein] hydrolase
MAPNRVALLRNLTSETAGGIRLFCVPHAGAGALTYRRWPAFLGPGIQVTAIQLPGREERLKEPGYKSLSPLIDDLVSVLAGTLDRPYALFGHSMGSLVAYETARRIRDRCLPPPVSLFCSGLSAPHLARRGGQISRLPDDEFRHAVVQLNGFPSEVAAHDRLMETLLPGLRRDLQVCEDYVYRPAPPLDGPLSVFGGTGDNVPRADLARWRELTTGPFRLGLIPGDHYAMTQREELARAVRSDLEKLAHA